MFKWFFILLMILSVGNVPILVQAQSVDTLPPVLEKFTPTNTTTTAKIVVEVNYNDQSGVSKTRYCWTSQNNCNPIPLDSGFIFTNGGIIQQTEVGVWHLCTAARDTIGNWSATECHGPYIKQVELIAPVPLLPVNESTNIAISDLELVWQPTNGVSNYLLTLNGVIGGNNQIQIFKNEQVIENRFIINANLLAPNARYEWTVVAQFPNGDILNSQSSVFYTVSVTEGEITPISTPGLTPASPFYFLDRSGEWLRSTFLSWGHNSQIDLALSRAQERLSELSELAINQRLRPTYLKKIQTSYNRATEQARQMINELSNLEQRAFEFNRLARLSERAQVVLGAATSRARNQLAGSGDTVTNMISGSVQESCQSLIDVQSNRAQCGVALNNYSNVVSDIAGLVQNTKNVLINTQNSFKLHQNVLTHLVSDIKSNNGYIATLGILSEKLSVSDDNTVKITLSTLRANGGTQQQMVEVLKQLKELNSIRKINYTTQWSSMTANAASSILTPSFNYLNDLSSILNNSTTTQTAALQLARGQISRSVLELDNELKNLDDAIEANAIIGDFDELQNIFTTIKQEVANGRITQLDVAIDQVVNNEIINRNRFVILRGAINESINILKQYKTCAVGTITSTAIQISNQLARTIKRLEQERANLEQVKRAYFSLGNESINDRRQRIITLKNDLELISNTIDNIGNGVTIEQVRTVLEEKLRITMRATTLNRPTKSLTLKILPTYANTTSADNIINREVERVTSIFSLNPKLSTNNDENAVKIQLRRIIRDETERERSNVQETLTQAETLLSSGGQLEDIVATLNRPNFIALLNQIQQLIDKGRFTAARSSADQFSNLVASLPAISALDNIRIKALQLVVVLQAALVNPQVRLFERLSEFKQFALAPEKCVNSEEVITKLESSLSNFNPGTTADEFITFCSNTNPICEQTALSNNEPVNSPPPPAPPAPGILKSLRIIKIQP